MIITNVSQNYEPEQLKAPFGFKGGSSSVLWNTAAKIESDNLFGVGLGVEGILWSDENVFFKCGNQIGSSMMYLMTAYALRETVGTEFTTPSELLEYLLPRVYEYGKKVTGFENLRKTFALNSLVAVDNAAWQLYFKSSKLGCFDDIMPSEFRHNKIACIPLISYGVDDESIINLADEGTPLFKIKIGKDPEWDKSRLNHIHELVSKKHTEYTDSGNILYYLDANGRYQDLEHIKSFLNYANEIGALERIILLEEPFSEGSGINVAELPICVAADESAHSDDDVYALAKLGYKAVALKPIAKTLSMSLKMLEAASNNGMSTFCADLTVNPIMVDWNKNVAARLKPLKGMKIGVLESNGAQNYKRWNELQNRHPCFGGEWITPHKSVFNLNEAFYTLSGGIFLDSNFYNQGYFIT